MVSPGILQIQRMEWLTFILYICLSIFTGVCTLLLLVCLEIFKFKNRLVCVHCTLVAVEVLTHDIVYSSHSSVCIYQ